jgi:hypothetical protein
LANTRRRFDRCSNYGVSLGLVFRTPYRPPASLRRVYLGTRAFVTSLRTSSGGLRTCTRPQVRCRRESVSKVFFGNRASDRNSKSESGHPSATLAFTAQADHRNDPSRCILLAKLISNRRLAEEFDVVVLGAGARRPTSVRTACVTQLDRRRRDSDQCRSWVIRVTSTLYRSLPIFPNKQTFRRGSAVLKGAISDSRDLAKTSP